MNSPVFPDAAVTKYIEDLAKEFSWIVASTTHEAKRYPSSLNLPVFETWTWLLKNSNSPIELLISVDYPNYYVGIGFSNESLSHSPKSFIFEEYLEKNLRCHQDVDLIKKISTSKSSKEQWRVPLEILKSHLRTDLKEVIEGKSWPTVYFDMADYVEPSTLDRLHKDQVNRVEEKSKTSRGWLHFLKIKKDK